MQKASENQYGAVKISRASDVTNDEGLALGAREKNAAGEDTIASLIAKNGQRIDLLAAEVEDSIFGKGCDAQKTIKQLLGDYILKAENFKKSGQWMPFWISNTSKYLWYWGFVMAWGGFPNDVNFNGLIFMADGRMGWHFWHSNDGRERDWEFHQIQFLGEKTEDPANELK